MIRNVADQTRCIKTIIWSVKELSAYLNSTVVVYDREFACSRTNCQSYAARGHIFRTDRRRTRESVL